MHISRHNRILSAFFGLLCITVGFFAPVSLSISSESLNSLKIISAPTLSLAQTIPSGVGSNEPPVNPVTGDADGDDGGCDWICQIGGWMGNLLLNLGGSVTWLGGTFFEFVLNESVVRMGEIFSTGGIGLVIDNTWQTVRDMVNVLFIFGFIYIGIRTILQPDNGRTKSFIAQLVIAALLVNFSLFFTKIVIDIANVFAVEVYALTGGSISQSFTHAMGVASIFEPSSGERLAALNTGGSMTFYFLGFLFLVLAGFVFAMGAVMLIIRFVGLILIMVFSPLLVAGFIFPQTVGLAKQLWGNLFAWAFYAPIFLFLIYISLQVMDASIFGSTGDNSFEAMLSTGSVDQFGVLFHFTIGAIFLIASMRIASMLSKMAGTHAVKAESAVRSRALRAFGGSTFGTGAGLLRGTVGAGGAAAARSAPIRNLATKGGALGMIGRTAQDTGVWASTKSFDARRAGGVGKTLEMGEGKKGGFAQDVKDIAKKEQGRAKLIGTDDTSELEEQERAFEPQIASAKRELRDKKQPILDQIQIASRDANNNKLTSSQRKAAQNNLESLKAQLETVTNELQSNVDDLESNRKELQREIKKTSHASQEEYASNLENRWRAKIELARKHGNKDAAKAIRKEFSKGENDRIIDALGDLKGSISKDT